MPREDHGDCSRLSPWWSRRRKLDVFLIERRRCQQLRRRRRRRQPTDIRSATYCLRIRLRHVLTQKRFRLETRARAQEKERRTNRVSCHGQPKSRPGQKKERLEGERTRRQRAMVGRQRKSKEKGGEGGTGRKTGRVLERKEESLA